MPTAQLNINQSIRGPITDLVATLLSGWASYGAGDTKTAVANIDKLTGPEWYPIFKDLHSGMILELAGKEKDAGVRLERAYKLDDSMLRVADAYARWLSRNKDAAAATGVYEAFDKKLARHPLVQEGLRETKAGKKLTPLVDTPQAGAAEALYGIGATLTRRGGEDLALVYLQLALYLDAQSFAGAAVAGRSLRVGEEAADGDQGLRAHAGQFAAEAQCADPARDQSRRRRPQRRGDQDPEGRHGGRSQGYRGHHGARQYRARPQEVRRLRPDLLAGHRCVAAATEKTTWVYYYYRGICEERSKQWSKAEADMRKALELQPEQPHVLNYLGYSWIDQGINLDEGMKMIKRAVDQRPDDGYIVDSLGWAYYRIGNYEDAVKNLERAIDLKPEDPTINDHLGDAYWRVGRTLEAKFQWAHARDLKPEPEELPKIEAKIENGLPEDASSSSAASADKKKEDGKGG